MRTARIGIVEDPQIAILGTAIGFRLCDTGLHRERHHTDKDRQAFLALDQRVARPRFVDAVRRIARLGNDGAERGAEQRHVHFVGNLFQPAFDNGEGNRIDAHAVSFWVNRFSRCGTSPPSASISSRCAGIGSHGYSAPSSRSRTTPATASIDM